MIKKVLVLVVAVAWWGHPGHLLGLPTQEHAVARAMLGEWHFVLKGVTGSWREGTAHFSTDLNGKILVAKHVMAEDSSLTIYRFEEGEVRAWLFEEKSSHPVLFVGNLGPQGLQMSTEGNVLSVQWTIEGAGMVAKCDAPLGSGWTRTYSRPK